MNRAVPETVLGVRLIEGNHERHTDLAFESSIPLIDRQLRMFLRQSMEQHRPELMIVVERKGTAILRALRESDDRLSKWPSHDIVSSNEVERLPCDLFRNKRILIFDDMMKRGIHIRKLLELLRGRGIWKPNDERIRVAVFALHEISSKGLPFHGETIPHFWFYRDLTQSAYQSARIQIVKMLQRAGSLLLDTEHLEVRAKLHGSFNRFVDALRRKADVIVFTSSDNRTNVTVFYPDRAPYVLPSHRFPRGTVCERIVKKCRIVERGDSEFAIIPIAFPAVEKVCETDWPSDPQDVDLLGRSVKTPVGRFYGVGLLAALEVLRWVLRDLAILDEGEYTLSLPRNPEEPNSLGGYCLDHLYAVYPTLNMGELVRRISTIAKAARSDGRLLRSIKFPRRRQALCGTGELRKWAVHLLQVMRHVLDQRIMSHDLYDSSGRCLKHPFGLRAREIFAIGRRLRLEDAVISALFDILIDEANIVTHSGEVEEGNNISRIARTFEPDGEVVSEAVRRYSRQWGLPIAW